MGSPEIHPEDGFGLVRSFTRHISFVKLAIHSVTDALHRRGMVHDMSKMLDDEFAGFSRINAAARVNKFGSPEYSEGMKREKPTIDLHFSRNSHHAERPGMLMEADPDTHVAMTFLDVIEMVCDWWGAGKGYDDPRPWMDSVELNIKNKGQYLTPEQMWLVREVAALVPYIESNDGNNRATEYFDKVCDLFRQQEAETARLSGEIAKAWESEMQTLGEISRLRAENERIGSLWLDTQRTNAALRENTLTQEQAQHALGEVHSGCTDCPVSGFCEKCEDLRQAFRRIAGGTA